MEANHASLFTPLNALLAVTVISLVWLIILLSNLLKNYHKLKQIPGLSQITIAPLRIPIISPYIHFSGAEHVSEYVRKYGDAETGIMRVSMCDHNTVWITGRELVKEVTMTKANNFEKPGFVYNMFEMFGENILSARDYEHWKKHHRIASPAFSTKNLEYMSQVAVQSSEHAVQGWLKQLQTESSFMLDHSVFDKITLDVLLNAGFGLNQSRNSQDDQFAHSLQLVMKRALILRRFFNETDFWYPYLAKWSGVKQALEIVEKKLDSIINDRKKCFEQDLENDERSDLLSLLVKANTADKVLTDMEVKSNAVLFALAGFETTSTALDWIFYELSKRPEILHKCQEEIEMVLAGRQAITFEDIPKFHYLNAVVFETLRYHAPVFEVVKYVSKKDTKLGKYDIPKGVSVHLLLVAINRNEKYWDNPKEFNPNRFLTEEQKERAQTDFTWLPFSVGNRKCIGYKFALIEIISVLSRLLHGFEFKLMNDETVDPVRTKVAVTSKPVNAKIQVRKK